MIGRERDWPSEMDETRLVCRIKSGVWTDCPSSVQLFLLQLGNLTATCRLSVSPSVCPSVCLWCLCLARMTHHRDAADVTASSYDVTTFAETLTSSSDPRESTLSNASCWWSYACVEAPRRHCSHSRQLHSRLLCKFRVFRDSCDRPHTTWRTQTTKNTTSPAIARIRQK